MALEWVQGNWTTGPGGSAGPEAEEAGSGSGFGSGHGGTEWAEGGAMLNVIWETEGLQTVGIVVLVCASIKLLHLLGLISFSEGKMWRRSVMRQKSRNLSSQRKLMSSRFLMCFCSIAKVSYIFCHFHSCSISRFSFVALELL